MLMTIIMVPLMVYTVVYVSLTLCNLFTGKDYRPDMNMIPETSVAMIVITVALTILMIMAFIGGAFNLPVEHGIVSNIATLMLYIAIAGSWYWLYECFQQRVYLKFIKR